MLCLASGSLLAALPDCFSWIGFQPSCSVCKLTPETVRLRRRPAAS